MSHRNIYTKITQTLNSNGSQRLVAGLIGILLSHASMADPVELSEVFANLSANPMTPEEFEEATPTSSNPWLSFFPDDVKPDMEYWEMKQLMHGKQAASKEFYPDSRMSVSRAHSFSNTGSRSFTRLPRFGTGKWQDASIEVSGEFEMPSARPSEMIPLPEDEGSIPLATEVLLTEGSAVKINAEIGDGDFGSAGTGSGDVDFYRLSNIKAWQTISIDIDTPEPFDGLNPVVVVYAANGLVIDSNISGDPSVSMDSFLNFSAPFDGDYFVSVTGFGTFGLSDAFDSSTGLGNIFDEPLNEGVYSVTFGLNYYAEETFVFVGRPGDVVGVGMVGGVFSGLSLFDPSGTERQGSHRDISFAAAALSPLPSGEASVAHVVDTFGVYMLKARSIGAGPYTIRLQAALPPLASEKGDVQTIFVDFDGATFDFPNTFPSLAPPEEPVVTLSPLASFLPNWGLSDADEDAVIDAIMKTLRKSLVRDIRREGDNWQFKIRLLNSRDHLDPFGLENVSRVIVGGTRQEFGHNTIGFASSIDIGNFDTEETAVVLLDVLSTGNPRNASSLNNFEIDESKTMIDIVGVGVGEIAAHEAGHYLGNFHTDTGNDQANLMDAGGRLGFTILGVGPDGIFGTDDDEDVMFGHDEHLPSEGFTGFENTLTSINWGATRKNPYLHYFIKGDESAKFRAMLRRVNLK